MGPCDRREIVSRSIPVGATHRRLNVSRTTDVRFYARRVAGRDRNHRHPCRAAPPCDSSGPRGRSPRQCQNNLKNVSLAVLNYESSSKTLPMGTVFPQLDGNGLVTNPTTMLTSISAVAGLLLFCLILKTRPSTTRSYSKILRQAQLSRCGMRNINSASDSVADHVVPFRSTKSSNVPRQWRELGTRGNYAGNLGLGCTHTLSTPPGSIQGPGSPAWKSPTARRDGAELCSNP